MQRDIYERFLDWKSSEERKPLLVKGVRQCGKTYMIKEFGLREYEDCAYFTFENNTVLSKVFEADLDPHRIIDEMSVLRSKRITEGTLIIFDEIQYCPEALASLKYFCDEAPEYHIIAAGSLLGVKLAQMKKGEPRFAFPVGKITLLDMYPMNFHEFVMASGNDALAKNLRETVPFEPVPGSFVPALESLFKEYQLTGGMPEAVKTWFAGKDPDRLETVLDDILAGYEADIMKYAPASDIPRIFAIWRSIPSQLSKENRKFLFGHAVRGSRASEMEDALHWLINAGMIYRVPLIEHPSIPLEEPNDNRSFKIYACDNGLLRRMANLSSEDLFDTDKNRMKGALGENIAIDSFIPLLGSRGNVFYWKNAKGDAEVDFLIKVNSNIVPIEVKTGKVPRLRSMEVYMQKYSPKVSVLISEKNVSGGNLRHVPFWLCWRLTDFCR